MKFNLYPCEFILSSGQQETSKHIVGAHIESWHRRLIWIHSDCSAHCVSCLLLPVCLWHITKNISGHIIFVKHFSSDKEKSWADTKPTNTHTQYIHKLTHTVLWMSSTQTHTNANNDAQTRCCVLHWVKTNFQPTSC